MKTISIILPVYNADKYIDDCLKSLINQTYDNFEIIIINDASTDLTEEKINKWLKSDDRIKEYKNSERKGVGFCRNLGVRLSNGELLYFIDSDDYITNNSIEILYNNIGSEDLIIGDKLPAHISHDVRGNKGETLKEIDVVTLFQDDSILNCLMKKTFILDLDLQFSEDVESFSELAFITLIIESKEKILYVSNASYFKRVRNDPISNPSLAQRDKKLVIQDFLMAYWNSKKVTLDSEKASCYLNNLFLSFYRKRISRYMADELSKNLYKHLKVAVQYVPDKLIKGENYIVKRELKAIKNGELKKYESVLIQNLKMRKLKMAMSGRTKLYTSLHNFVFSKLPIKQRTVIFESFLGKNYSDSPKYIYEYMLRKNLDFKYIWILNDARKNIIGNPKKIQRFSLKYYYYLATSKYWVSNSRMPKRLNKRKDNIYLQTWHGTPLKHLVFDMNEVHSANANYKADFYNQSRRWDYLVSANRYSSVIFERAFKYNKDILEYGYPRNDILYSDNIDDRAKDIKSKLNLPRHKKIILYAPTWRDDEFYSAGKYKFNLQLDLENMQKKFGEDYIIILRMHYFIANQLDLTKYEGFAFDYSKYDDIAELYLISDLLITDYSSVFFDYANLKRPILFFAYDLDKYRDELRGFYFDIEKDGPGPILRTSKQVIDAIENIDKVKLDYKDKYQQFYNTFCELDDGKATERIVQQVFKIK